MPLLLLPVPVPSTVISGGASRFYRHGWDRFPSGHAPAWSTLLLQPKPARWHPSPMRLVRRRLSGLPQQQHQVSMFRDEFAALSLVCSRSLRGSLWLGTVGKVSCTERFQDLKFSLNCFKYVNCECDGLSSTFSYSVFQAQLMRWRRVFYIKFFDNAWFHYFRFEEHTGHETVVYLGTIIYY